MSYWDSVSEHTGVGRGSASVAPSLDESAAADVTFGEADSLLQKPRERGRFTKLKSTVSVVLLVLVVASFSIYAGMLIGQQGLPPSGEQDAVPKEDGHARVRVQALKLQWSAGELHMWCNGAIALANELTLKMKAWSGTDESLLEVLNQQNVILDDLLNMAALMSEVHPNAAVRKAARSCERDASSLEEAFDLDGRLYSRFLHAPHAAVQTRSLADRRSDSPKQKRARLLRRLRKKTLRDFERSGVKLDAKKRVRLQRLSDKMDELSQAFDENLANDVRYVHVPASDAAMLRGLDADFVQQRTKAATVSISTEAPDFYPASKMAANATLRYNLYMKKLSCGMPHNEHIIQQLLDVRHEYAQLLGFTTYADYTLQNKMVKSAANAERFLEKVRKLVRPRVQSEVSQLLALKRKADDGNASTVWPYDAPYLSERIRASRYKVSASEVRKYFTYAKVREGVFRTAERLFGVKVVKGEAKHGVWHPSVQQYELLDSDGALIGTFLLDSFPRRHKFKHTAQFAIRKGVQGVQTAVGALVCNFDELGLMEHDDVTTLFHEFGHLLHSLFGGMDQRWVRFSGVSTEWDFVEAPSQMLESWAWDQRTLGMFARDASGAVIPRQLVTKMQNGHRFGRGLDTQTQLFFSMLSLKLHQGKVNATELLSQLAVDWAPLKHVSGTHFLAGFSHLTDYAATYYGYQWSLAIAKDMLSKFEDCTHTASDDAHGTCKPNLYNHAVAQRYRQSVLSQGGKEDAAELLKHFLGRPWSFDAYRVFLNTMPADQPDSGAATRDVQTHLRASNAQHPRTSGHSDAHLTLPAFGT